MVLWYSEQSTNITRETREGWPLLTVETEVNGDYKLEGSFIGWFGGLVVPLQEFVFCLGCSSRPVQNFFFLPIQYFNFFVSIDQQARQAALLGRLSLSMFL
jgi:hypothetical protein